jgi:hypothetical protein
MFLLFLIISDPSLDINKKQEVSLNNYVPHPVCVTGLALSSLKTEYGTYCKHNPHVIMYHYCGYLFFSSPDPKD